MSTPACECVVLYARWKCLLSVKCNLKSLHQTFTDEICCRALICPCCQFALCTTGASGWQPVCFCHSSFFKSDDDDAPIKRCPKCKVYIERDEGCAQMMCKNCKHAFCWYCLESLDVSAPSLKCYLTCASDVLPRTNIAQHVYIAAWWPCACHLYHAAAIAKPFVRLSLTPAEINSALSCVWQDDFLLIHYDKGPCRNKLGHSRASVIWHRTQVGTCASPSPTPSFSFFLFFAPLRLWTELCDWKSVHVHSYMTEEKSFIPLILGYWFVVYA